MEMSAIPQFTFATDDDETPQMLDISEDTGNEVKKEMAPQPSASMSMGGLALPEENIPCEILGNAVEVTSLSFGYTKNAMVLQDIKLNVPKGRIYALLGSSGCGKTTLLRILLGRLTPSKGTIKCFGEAPGTKTAHIPGPGVGYMPQELALFTEFTLEETFQYFGAIHHMNQKAIEERMDFLLKLLNLPTKKRKVAQLSGGQQRRASIAVTLFHSPPLLILDEPTVGVDPLLRCRIWEYLENLCEEEGMTVIITTHYIEESRNAGTIAFMRFGRLLVQSTPDYLLRKYQCKALEDVFLILCEQDCGEIKRRASVKQGALPAGHNPQRRLTAFEIKTLVDPEINNPFDPNYRKTVLDMTRLKALFHKNYLKFRGNPLLVVFFLILPVVQITLFCESVVKQPDHLPVAIYSPEITGNLSDMFLSTLDPLMIKKEFFLNFDAAIERVKEGKAWYAISLAGNFSDAFNTRATDALEMTDDEIESSKIKLYPDHSDSFIQQFLYQSIFESYQTFLEKYVASQGLNPGSVSLPIETQKPVYGEIVYSLINSIAPGAIVAIIYSTPLLLASFLIVLERKDGVLERSFVGGVRSIEVLIAHMTTLVLALVVQVALLMFVTFVLFKVELLGPVAEVFGLIFLQGLLGISFGLLISSFAPHETGALLMAFGLVFPMWMICGVFWPLQSVPEYLRIAFYFAPLSLPIDSIRYVISRGWTIFYFDVQIGFMVSAAYNIVLFGATVLVFHITAAS